MEIIRPSAPAGTDLAEIIELHKEWVETPTAEPPPVSLAWKAITAWPAGAVELSGADLSNAEILRFDHPSSVMRGIQLSGAIVHRARLKDCQLGPRVSGLVTSQESCSDLRNAVLRNADLAGADMQGALLQGTDLTNATLRGADLTGARLSARTRLSGADLSDANLGTIHHIGWLVTFTRGWLPFYRPPFWFDETDINRTRFPPGIDDPWSALRRRYTGPKMAFALIASLAALLPVVAQVMFWVGVNRVEASALAVAGHSLRRVAAQVEQTDPSGIHKAWVQRARASASDLAEDGLSPLVLHEFLEVAAQLDSLISHISQLQADEGIWLEEVRRATQLIDPDGNMRVEERRVWQILLGGRESGSPQLLIVLLLVYNALRLGLTYFVGPLGYEEQRSGLTPRKSNYQWLWYVHVAASILLLLSLYVGARNVCSLLNTNVLVPG